VRQTITALSIVEVAGEVIERPATETLPFTGAQSTWLATVAALLVAAGAALFMVARKRRNEA
jgi:LPXTG-motif cell wall-anchored protein